MFVLEWTAACLAVLLSPSSVMNVKLRKSVFVWAKKINSAERNWHFRKTNGPVLSAAARRWKVWIRLLGNLHRFKSKQSVAAGLFIESPLMAEPAWLLLSMAAWVGQILWHVTCGYRKCSPGGNGVQDNVWLCLKSPCVSSGSFPAIRKSGHDLGKKKNKKKTSAEMRRVPEALPDRVVSHILVLHIAASLLSEWECTHAYTRSPIYTHIYIHTNPRLPFIRFLSAQWVQPEISRDRITETS